MNYTAEQRMTRLAQFIFESDAIEGIEDDMAVLTGQLAKQKKNGHVGAMLLLERIVQARGLITEELTRKIQGLITAEQHLKPGGPRLPRRYIGRYRPEGTSVVVGGRVCIPSQFVPTVMAELLARVIRWQQNAWFPEQDYNIRCVADFHFSFEIINPFVDGNGRTGRALAYYLMRWADLNPIVFTNHDKRALYYPCFKNPDDSSLMQRYFFGKMTRDHQTDDATDEIADWQNEGGR